MKENILLIGASGFVGKTVYKLFKDKSFPVLGIDLLDNTDYKIDILKDFDSLKKLISEIKPFAIINLAAFSNSQQCNANKEWVYSLNVNFVEKLFDICEESNVRIFVQCSSEWVYGDGPIDIKSAISPFRCYHNNLDLYSRSKLDSELSLFRMATKSSIKTIIDRFGIIYGNIDNPSNCVVDYIIKNYLNNKQIELRSKLAGRCFISVDDISYSLYANINNKIIKKEKNLPEIYNLQGPHFYQLGKIIDYLFHNKTDLINATLDNKSDIKIVASDFKKITGIEPKCLSEYLNLFVKK